jgi:hypothetical protein
MDPVGTHADMSSIGSRIFKSNHPSYNCVPKKLWMYPPVYFIMKMLEEACTPTPIVDDRKYFAPEENVLVKKVEITARIW